VSPKQAQPPQTGGGCYFPIAEQHALSSRQPCTVPNGAAIARTCGWWKMAWLRRDSLRYDRPTRKAAANHRQSSWTMA
jgi:hypothetical protein